MANTHPRKAVQSAHTSDHINFGHFGTATYTESDSQWTFLRQPLPENLSNVNNQNCPFRLVKDAVRILSTVATPCGIPTDLASKITTNQWLNTVPDAASSNSHYNHEAAQSLLWPTADHSERSVLAFGDALVLGSYDAQSDFQVVPVAAFVSLVDPSILRLMLMNREVTSVDLVQHRQIWVPRIAEENSVTWPSQAGPVHQLRFSKRSSSQGATWLAARQSSATSVFRPLLHRMKAKTTRSPSLDINEIIVIPCSRTGGLQHADVAFHPQSPYKIAIIDVGGNWSVWKIDGTQAKTTHILYRARLQIQGSFATQPEHLQQFDGWHRLLFLSSHDLNIDRLLVSNRQAVALLDLQGSSLSEVDMRIGSRGVGYVLDIQPGKGLDELFVLTASHVFCMAVVPGRTKTHGKSMDQMITRASWNHFRNHHDTTLAMTILDTKDDVWLLIHSTSNSLVTVYRIEYHQTEQSIRHCVSDGMPFDTSRTEGSKLKYLLFQSVTASHVVANSDTEPRGFIKLFFQTIEGTIYESIYHLDWLDAGTNHFSDAILLPKQLFLLHKSAHKVVEEDLEDGLNDFVVDDDYQDSDEGSSTSSTDEIDTNQLFLEAAQSNAASLTNNKDVHIYDLQNTYNTLAAQMAVPVSEDRTKHVDIAEISRYLISQSTIAQTLSHLTASLPEADIRISDIDLVSHRLESWLSEFNDKSTGHVCDRISAGPKPHDERSVIDIYDTLIADWLTSMSTAVPDRIRVQRERLSRQTALELYLSDILIRPNLLTESQQLAESEQAPHQYPYTLPLRHDESSDDMIPTSSISTQYQSQEQPKEAPSLLSQYIKFDQPHTLAEREETAVRNILTHLPTSIDADPDQYSFNNAELNLVLARNELITQGMDAKSRKKMEKLARAQKRKLEKQRESKRMAFDNTTALPSIMSSQLPIRGIQSSQAGPYGSSPPSIDSAPQVSMTQPERGVFGKRDGKKAKSKVKGNRQKGF